MALDIACEQIFGQDNNGFSACWEAGMNDIFEGHLTSLEENLYKLSTRRQQRFIETWAVALATRTQ